MSNDPKDPWADEHDDAADDFREDDCRECGGQNGEHYYLCPNDYYDPFNELLREGHA